MEYLLDNKEDEHYFKELLSLIKLHKSGVISEAMTRQGVVYKKNWGVSINDLRSIASRFESSHLLALKLWNKQWRESMILATMLDDPGAVTENQMDFWTRSFENSEIAEQASANLWVKTPYAFIKSLEWCRGKRHLIRYTGVHLSGRLAIVHKEMPDEMFEPFFGEFDVLGRDPLLYTVIYRAVVAIANRGEVLFEKAFTLAEEFVLSNYSAASSLGTSLLDELSAWKR